MANVSKSNTYEKYYTPKHLLEKLKELVETQIGLDNITEFLENSAGAGNIIDMLKPYNKPILAYDIFNETNRGDIIEENYLNEQIPYKKGRVAVINPPFSIGLRFVYKALKESDHVVCILSSNSLMNLDYDNYEIVNDIYLYQKCKFGTIKTDVMILHIKKK